MQGPDTDAQDQSPPFFRIRLATHGRSIQSGHRQTDCPEMPTSALIPITDEVDRSRSRIWVPRCEGHQAFTGKVGAIHYAVTTIGLDLAKTFSVHGVDATDQVVVRRSLRRSRMLPFLPVPLACSASRRAARRITGRAADQLAVRFG